MKIHNILFEVGLKVIAIIVFAVSLLMAIRHPLFPVIISAAYFLYLLALIKFPGSWVIFLFALLPITDLGMWTGNILYDEYDIFFLETMGFLIFRGIKIVNYSFKYDIFFFCLLLLFVESTLRGLWGYFDGGHNYDIHLSYLNSIRVGKGFLSAWLTWFFLRKQLYLDYRNTVRLLGYGIFIGLFCFSILVLWERHIFSAMLSGGGVYGILSNLLDFSGTYRITGFFSGMHVGGTAVDGYLICVLPLCFYVVSKKYNSYLWLLTIGIFFLGIYCLVVTFTRMTVASCFFSLLVSMVMLIFKSKTNYEKYSYSMFASFLVFIAILGGLITCYSNTGYQGLLLGFIDISAAILVGYFSNTSQRYLWFAGFVFVVLLSIFGIYNSITNSHWHHDVSGATAIYESVMFTLFFTGIGFYSGKYLKLANLSLAVLRIPMFTCVVLIFVGIGILSSRMEQRFKDVGQDFIIRQNHWLNVIDTRTPDSFLSSFLGEGMGAMPRQYYVNNYDKKQLPSYDLVRDEGKNHLKLGVGGYPFHQKVPLSANTNYRLLVSIKSEAEGENVSVDICHKHILFSESWQPDCVNNTFTAKDNTWGWYEWKFNSGNLGISGWADWPVTLQLHNYGKNPIEVASVELFDENDMQIVRNSDFADEFKYWFWTSDFEHLPWHSKQLFIHIWLEQGWLGEFLFALLLFFGFFRQTKLFRQNISIPMALLPAMVGILGLGLTDTFIDEPQISLFVFCILFAAMQWPVRRTKQL